jgi:hypothetical protein
MPKCLNHSDAGGNIWEVTNFVDIKVNGIQDIRSLWDRDGESTGTTVRIRGLLISCYIATIKTYLFLISGSERGYAAQENCFGWHAGTEKHRIHKKYRVIILIA